MNFSRLLFTAWSYVLYRWRSKGPHDLHSPFLFNLYISVIEPSRRFKINFIEEIRTSLRRDPSLLLKTNFKDQSTQQLAVSRIAKSSSSSRRFSAFLHHLAGFLSANVILETGTSFGINTLYLAESGAEIHTIEGNEAVARVARKFLNGHDRAFLHAGTLDRVFEKVLDERNPDMIFLDADHQSTVICSQIDSILSQPNLPKAIVIHDIYWSRDMRDGWKKIIEDDRILLTVDIFAAGLVFPKLSMEKQHFVLKF